MFCFFLNKEIRKLSPDPLNKCDRQKRRHIHNLLDVLNDPMKIRLNRIITQRFQLKLFDTPVTLKYGQGH